MTPTKPPPKNQPSKSQPSKSQRPKQRQALTGRKRRSSAAMLTWGSVILVVVVVLVIVLVDTLGGKAKPQRTTFPFPSPIVVQDATNVPSSVFNTVGITSAVAQVGGFQALAHQPALTYKKLPVFVYYGAEYCPYCAATRWAIIAALSRFGTFTNLREMESSGTDVYPDTHTFTFRGSTYSSKYLAFLPYEAQDRNGKNLTIDPPTNVKKAIVDYNGQGSFPFLDFGNHVFLIGTPYNPQVLQGESWSQIAGGLSSPSNYGTQAIVATANYITAGICAMTKDAPASVCTSPGVKTALTALKLG